MVQYRIEYTDCLSRQQSLSHPYPGRCLLPDSTTVRKEERLERLKVKCSVATPYFVLRTAGSCTEIQFPPPSHILQILPFMRLGLELLTRTRLALKPICSASLAPQLLLIARHHFKWKKRRAYETRVIRSSSHHCEPLTPLPHSSTSSQVTRHQTHTSSQRSGFDSAVRSQKKCPQMTGPDAARRMCPCRPAD